MSKVLICGVNWLGDGIMSMPAINVFKKRNPDIAVSMLVKRNMAALWQMNRAVNEVIELDEGFVGTVRTAEKINRLGFQRAYIFPNSFRSALIPFLAGIAVRRGVSGRHRSFLLNDIVRGEFAGRHQSEEYFSILGVEVEDAHFPLLGAADDAISISISIRNKHLGSLESGRKVIALIPGAAYGLSKMWPSEFYADVSRRLIKEFGCSVIVMGSEAEKTVCMRVSEEIGANALCLAGETTLHESASLLAGCSVVICNDSGGMHLAAAAGAHVVAVYGVTDPVRTGPMGVGHKLIMAEGVNRNRDLDRNSSKAIQSLRSISPDRVYAAVAEFLR